ncbi:MAG: hypothetical protein ACREQB_01890 [Candidatus Binataceae bacterium]
MTKLGPPMEGDRERARKIIAEVRERIMPFADYHNALEQGFTIYLPKLPQSEYHFFGMVPPAVHFQAGRHPLALTALMYAPAESSGYRLAGAMIRANADTPLPKLDQIAPMSIGRWHRHINVCLPRGFTLMDFVRGNLGQDRSGLPGMLPADDDAAAAARNAALGVLADGRFGGGGALNDPVKCEAAGGYLVKSASGWMLHVYPLAGDDFAIAFGDGPPPAQSSAAVAHADNEGHEHPRADVAH